MLHFEMQNYGDGIGLYLMQMLFYNLWKKIIYFVEKMWIPESVGTQGLIFFKKPLLYNKPKLHLLISTGVWDSVSVPEYVAG